MQEEIEVMRVVRVPPMGKLVVQTGGNRLTRLTTAANPQVKHRLLAAIGELVAFAGGYQVLVDAGVAPPLPGSVKETRPADPPDETLNDQQEAFLNSLEKELNASTGQGASLDTVESEEQLQELLAEADIRAPEPGPTLNLVDEIDAILQKHVSADSALANRSIHLRQPPDGLLQIVVDGNIYQHPNDIEDAGVRQVLKQALQEWEGS